MLTRLTRHRLRGGREVPEPKMLPSVVVCAVVAVTLLPVVGGVVVGVFLTVKERDWAPHSFRVKTIVRFSPAGGGREVMVMFQSVKRSRGEIFLLQLWKLGWEVRLMSCLFSLVTQEGIRKSEVTICFIYSQTIRLYLLFKDCFNKVFYCLNIWICSIVRVTFSIDHLRIDELRLFPLKVKNKVYLKLELKSTFTRVYASWLFMCLYYKFSETLKNLFKQSKT